VTKIPRRAGVRPFCPSLHENSRKQGAISYEIREGPVIDNITMQNSKMSGKSRCGGIRELLESTHGFCGTLKGGGLLNLPALFVLTDFDLFCYR
jgi:hypothetical protein